MADADVLINDNTATSRKVDTRTVGAGTDEHRQVVVVGDPTTAANVQTVDSTGRASVTVPSTLTQGNITIQNSVPNGTATAGSAVLSPTLASEAMANVQVVGTYTGALSLQGTLDGAVWVTISNTAFYNVNSTVMTTTIASGVQGIFTVNTAGYTQIRVVAQAAVTGTAAVSIRTVAGPSVTNTVGRLSIDQTQSGTTNAVALLAGTALVGKVGIDQTTPGTTNLVALAANQSTNVAQINGVTPLMGNGATGTGALRVSLANDSTGKVVPSVAMTAITVTPVITAGAYGIADVVGAANTISGAASSSGGAGQIVSARLVDKAKVHGVLECWIFKLSPSLVGIDNAAFDITDANLLTALPVGVITFAAADYVDTASNSFCYGRVNGGAPILPFVTSGSANLFCAFVIRTVTTYASTSDLVLYLEINQY